MFLLKLAWRNIWRNRRRTFITMASIVMAVVLSSVMSSMQQGQYDQMIENSVGSFSGHIQIQAPDYFEEPMLDHSLEINEALLSTITETPNVRAVIPRIDSYGLAGGIEKTRPALVVGIDWEQEKALSKPHEKITSGRYFNSNSENSTIISEGLADYLELSVGDSLVLLSSGYRGVTAADLIPIVGIAKFGIPEMNKSLVYLPLNTAQQFYGATGRVTAIAILSEQSKKTEELTETLSSALGNDYRVYDWPTLMPELVQAIQADRGSGYIILLVLYMVVGFGIFGTILMMTAERKFEFGVLIAIGTPKWSISRMLMIEMFIITTLASMVGILLSIPVIYYFNTNPMEFTGQAAAAIADYGMEPFIRFSTEPVILFIQAAIIGAISLVISIYPLIHTKNLEPVEAMRA
ncbi:MAG: ABC transporter permease [Balneolaceae bacterium]|nr:ABC transporter permease [Balneolaceae bacterium]